MTAGAADGEGRVIDLAVARRADAAGWWPRQVVDGDAERREDATDVIDVASVGSARRWLGALSSVRAWLDQPVDGASLGAFRMLFGGLLVVAVLRTWMKGGIEDAFVTPRFFFSYWGLSFVRPGSPAVMYAVFAAMGVLAAMLCVGAFSRVSAALLCALFTYAHLCDQTNYLNHYYLISLLLALSAVLPVSAAFSVDRALARRVAPAVVPRWTVALVQLQIGLVYFYGGVAKLGADWLLRAMPLRIWLAASGDFPILGPLFRITETAYVMSWLGAAFDLSAGVLLAWRRSRPFAYAVVVVFHLATARLFQIGMFPWVMMGITLVFFSPSWPRVVLGWLGLASPPGASGLGAARGVSAAEAPSPRLRGAMAVFVAAWIVVQVVAPLRQRLYAGNALWTEQGYRFSWCVMLVEKTGWVELVAVDPATGASRAVRLRDTLTPLQVKMMSTQPDMILAFARHVADEAEARGEPRPQVHADVEVVMNGRDPARLIDPRVDLAAEREGLAPKRWVLPAPP